MSATTRVHKAEIEREPVPESVFGRQLRFDLAMASSLVTTKKVHLKSIIHELLWFLRGETNVGSAEAWSTSGMNGRTNRSELGPVYGYQWRSWPAPTAAPSIRSPRSSIRSEPIPIHDASSSVPGTWVIWIAWRWLHATVCSSSASPSAVMPKLYRHAPISFSAFPSTSPPTPC